MEYTEINLIFCFSIFCLIHVVAFNFLRDDSYHWESFFALAELCWVIAVIFSWGVAKLTGS